jgi:hypothetical protein
VVLSLCCGSKITLKYMNPCWIILFLKNRNLGPNVRTKSLGVGNGLRASDVLKWQHRFGHTSMRGIQRIVHQKMAKGLPEHIEHAPFTCIDCLKSKSLQRRTTNPEGGTLGPLELIVTDIGGPFPALIQGAI